MSELGTRTTDLTATSAIDEVVGNKTVDGILKTVRMLVDDLATQLMGSTAFSSAFAEMQEAVDAAVEEVEGQIGAALKPQAGIFLTRAELGHRMGQLAYAIDGSGKVRLITDLNRWLPRGWNARSVAELPPGVTGCHVKRSTSGGAPSDANTGADWANAFASVEYALNDTDFDVVFVEGGQIYDLSRAMGTYTGNRNVAVIAVGRPAIMSVQRETNWSAGSEPGTWISDPLGGTPTGVVDGTNRDAFGAYARFSQVDNQAAVASAEGDAWCIVPSTPTARACIKRADGEEPTNTTTWVYRATDNWFSGTGCVMYLYNFIFPEGFSARNSDASSIIVAHKCDFTGRVDQNGYQILGVGLSIAWECRFPDNFNDGANYTPDVDASGNPLTPHWFELDCFSGRNRAIGTGNGSTSHGDCVGIRMGTLTYDNNGPGIADIDTTKTMDIGVICDSNGKTNPNANCYGIVVQGTGKKWVHGARASGNAAAQQIAAKENATLYYADCNPIPVALDAAQVIAYDPAA